MKYAKILDGGVTRIGRPQSGERRIDTGEWITPHRGEWTEDLLALCGWVPIDVDPVPDHDPMTHKPTKRPPVVSGGRVIQGWDLSPLSADEMEREDRRRISKETPPGLISKALGPGPLTDPEIRELLRHLIAGR